MNSLSSAQFSVGGTLGVEQSIPTSPTPTSMNATTFSTAGKATAWTTKSMHGQAGKISTPLPLSKRTRGSYISWDDDSGSPSMPQSDPGSNYALGR